MSIENTTKYAYVLETSFFDTEGKGGRNFNIRNAPAKFIWPDNKYLNWNKKLREKGECQFPKHIPFPKCGRCPRYNCCGLEGRVTDPVVNHCNLIEEKEAKVAQLLVDMRRSYFHKIAMKDYEDDN